MSEYVKIDWKHIEEEVIEMQEILKENGNPDPESFRSARYDELRDDILTELWPFTGKEESFFNSAENRMESSFGNSTDGMPFANMLIDKIHKEGKYTGDMLSEIDELLLEAFRVILCKIPGYDPDEKASFETYIVSKCYYAMLEKYKKDNTTEKSVRVPQNEKGETDTKKSSKREKIYTTHDYLERELNDKKQTYLDTIAGPDRTDAIDEPAEESRHHPFMDDEFDRVFPQDYFTPEERCLIKVLTKEKNSEYGDFLQNIGTWIEKKRQENTLNTSIINDCAYYYDSVIDYICEKGNPVFLEKFFANRKSYSEELKRLGLESPEHQPYTADYIYSICLRIKHRRARLKKLRR